MSEEPSTTSTNTRLIGRKGHDDLPDWDRLAGKYCNLVTDHIKTYCGGWGDLGLDAFADAVARIRKQGGLFIKNYKKGKFRRALIRLTRNALSDLGRKRDKRKKDDRELAEALRILGRPSPSSGMSDEEIVLRGIKFRICRALLSGEYLDTDLANKFTADEKAKVILWRHAVLKMLSRMNGRVAVAEAIGISEEEIDRLAAEEVGVKPWVVTRAKQAINAKIDRLAAEEFVRRFGGCHAP